MIRMRGRKMKRFTAITMLLLVALLMLSACTGSSAGSEKEDNNTLELANNISLDSTMKGKIGEIGDEDWFVFNVSAPSEISVKLTPGRWAVKEVYWFVDLYDGEEDTYRETYKMSNRTEGSFDIGVLPKGTYYLIIRSSMGGSHISYTMDLIKDHECNPVEHIIQAPFCTEDGSAKIDCAICGELIDYKILPATGHQSANWTIDAEPTCKSTGSRHGTCIECGQEVTEILEVTDHRFGDWKVVSGNIIIPPIVKEQRCVYCGYTETTKDWGYVWVTVLAGIAAIGVCFGIVAYIKAYKNP